MTTKLIKLPKVELRKVPMRTLLNEQTCRSKRRFPMTLPNYVRHEEIKYLRVQFFKERDTYKEELGIHTDPYTRNLEMWIIHLTHNGPQRG